MWQTAFAFLSLSHAIRLTCGHRVDLFMLAPWGTPLPLAGQPPPRITKTPPEREIPKAGGAFAFVHGRRRIADLHRVCYFRQVAGSLRLVI